MSKGQSKPETVSVRIREDDYAQIREIANFYNVKVVDAIESFVKLWGMLDKEDQDLVFLGEPIEQFTLRDDCDAFASCVADC